MGSSNQLPFRIEKVYASNATVGDGNRNRVLVFRSRVRKWTQKIGERMVHG